MRIKAKYHETREVASGIFWAGWWLSCPEYPNAWGYSIIAVSKPSNQGAPHESSIQQMKNMILEKIKKDK